jgi:hypothetical protein
MLPYNKMRIMALGAPAFGHPTPDTTRIAPARPSPAARRRAWRWKTVVRMLGQLDLFAPASHVTEVYILPKGLWGVDKSVKQQPWWAWRCSCGRDVGAEQRAAAAWRAGAEDMARRHEAAGAAWRGWSE